VKRELRVGVRSLPRRPLLALAAWSVPEALPTALSGLAVARAVDSGFLAGRPLVGLAWLAALLVASAISAVGTRQVYRRLGDLVEPFRDELVRRVVDGALRRGVAGRPDDGAVARLTHQVEIVRDTYAGLIVVVRGFIVTVVGAVIGLLSIAPVVVLLVLPPFLLGLGGFLCTLGMSASRQRAFIRADERLAAAAGAVLDGVRDLAARGAEQHAARLVAGPIQEQADAERALARAAALRTLCFAVGGWLPLVILLAAGPWLAGHGLTAGAIMGGLTYVLRGLQPALGSIVQGLGGSGMRFVVTLARILDTGATPVHQPVRATPIIGYDLVLHGVSFAYGPHAEPVLRDLNLVIAEGDHLAIVGPSGVGKSTLAGLLCGLLAPDSGAVLLGAAPLANLPAERLAGARVLIPQEAYVFTGTVWDNLVYLRPTAALAEVTGAVAAVGAKALIDRLGGYRVELIAADLSAGERQLIALARAYLSTAPIAVLDEATCHLDPAAERRAEQAFADRGGTLIVIAHRVSSALRARRILVLDGVQATLGEHSTLMSTSPLYQDLLGHWQARPAVTFGGQIQPAS
jgi:ATP-binding cassette subfamily C protein